MKVSLDTKDATSRFYGWIQENPTKFMNLSRLSLAVGWVVFVLFHFQLKAIGILIGVALINVGLMVLGLAWVHLATFVQNKDKRKNVQMKFKHMFNWLLLLICWL